MRTTRFLKRLTDLTPLLFAGALVVASGAAAHARQAAVFAFDERTETLRHASPAVRAATREAIPALVKAIADKDEIVRGMAAESLEQLGADALPELKRAAASDNKKLAAAAAELLQQMKRS